ncbi:MAG: class I mannose-6-phosphate isomerase [Flavobacteriaceae bacterium]|nr:class I mannose-6-phosphate isomerase [Flavobacteriaceae bacterium]
MKIDYPLKFYPILKERLWGGFKLNSLLHKEKSEQPVGESWEISAVEGSVSAVANGDLKDLNLRDLINRFPLELLGQSVLDRYGKEFPLLIKFLDAHSDLSIQLHPNDELAMQRHHSLGKEEMWYIMEAAKDSRLMFGFNQKLDKVSYSKHLKEDTLESILHFEKVQKGDVFHIPAGRVHAIGGGIILAEIQQSSDITYRLFDWNRLDDQGNSRELHTNLALDAIDFTTPQSFKTSYHDIKNKENTLIEGTYFSTHFLNLNQSMHFDHKFTDTFVIYIGVEGSGRIVSNKHEVSIQMGETILIPAQLQQFSIIPENNGIKLIQVTP